MKPAMWCTAALIVATGMQADKKVRLPSDDEHARIAAAMPEEPPAIPIRARRLLVLGDAAFHEPVPYAARALEIMARKTGAFEAVATDDGSMLEPHRLAAFDAVVVNNWHGFNPFLPVRKKDFDALPNEKKEKLRAVETRRRQALLDFVAGGKGIVGIHAATVGLDDWKEWGELIGGRYAALPWMGALVRVEDPSHPLCAGFSESPFRISDEIYELKEPYSREKVRVLLSVDPSEVERPKEAKYGTPVRTDGDYPLSWVKSYGKGRVFYCALGHFRETYWNPAMLRHFLAGIQFAVGDLTADTTPSAGPNK